MLESADKKVPKFSLAGLETKAKIVKVYDGDTIWAVFEYAGKISRFNCRMNGYNSAEMRTDDPAEKESAVKSKEALAELVLDKIVDLHLGDFDKYGRPLVQVYSGGVDVNKYMVENGFGKKYTGRGAKEW